MESPEAYIIKELTEKKYRPIYFLMGEEPYYIDLISNFIEKNVLSEKEKAFNQTILYASEIDVFNILEYAKRYPMMSPYTVLIVKEAQFLLKSIEKLVDYIENPLKSTILVICYKNKSLDRRSKLCNLIEKNGILFESKKYREYQIPGWIKHHLYTMNRHISIKAQHFLAEYLGTCLSNLAHELEKIHWTLPEGEEITFETVSQHISISKYFNSFEWQKAIAEKNFPKAQQIAWHFGKNPKGYPLVFLINTVFRFFINLAKYHLSIPNHQAHLAKVLNISPHFIGDYEKAAHVYPLNKILKIFSYLRQADRQAKGINSSIKTELGILQELTYKIFLNE